MSIEVSVQIAPSRILKILTVAMCVGCLAIGLSIGFSIGFATTNALPLWVRVAIAGTCILAVLVVLIVCKVRSNFLPGSKTWQLDVSATGIISVVVDSPHSKLDKIASLPRRRSCTLLTSSTLWSSLMILNLQEVSGPKHTLVVLRDTVSQENFRALSVACRWIAAHTGVEGENA